MSEAGENLACQRGIPRWPEASQSTVSFATAAAPRPPPEPRLPILSFDDIRGREFKSALPIVADIAAGDAFDGFGIGDLGLFTECQWVEVPAKLASDRRFIVRVAGDSMAPTLSSGDLVVFEYHRRARRDNQIVIMAEFPDYATAGECAIKRITEEPESWVFNSDNTAYAERTIAKTDSEYPILGTFVGKL